MHPGCGGRLRLLLHLGGGFEGSPVIAGALPERSCGAFPVCRHAGERQPSLLPVSHIFMDLRPRVFVAEFLGLLRVAGVHGGRREGADLHREVRPPVWLHFRLPADLPVVLLPGELGASRRGPRGETDILASP